MRERWREGGREREREREGERGREGRREGEKEEGGDGYFVAHNQITLLCILFMFIKMKFIHCHSCVIFIMKSMSMCND